MTCEPIPEFLEIRDSTVKGAGKGVFTKKAIKKDTSLGEYKGKLLSIEAYKKKPHHCDYIWEIMDEDDNTIAYIDGGNKKYSNWTRYVNCPCTKKQNNIVPIQKRFKMFYYTNRDIEKGEELFVWYGPSYGKKLTGKDTLEE